MSDDRIEREVEIAAPIERVWAVLTEAEHVGVWFGDAGAEIDLRPGGAMSFSWTGHGTSRARVERVDPPRFLSYRWVPLMDVRGAEPAPGNSTLVEFTLSDHGDRTVLRVVESGFSQLDRTPDVRATAVADNTEGWASELDELRVYAEQLVRR